MIYLIFALGFIADVCISSYYFTSVLAPKKNKKRVFLILLGVQIPVAILLTPLLGIPLLRIPLVMITSVILLLCLFRDYYWKRLLVMFSYFSFAALSELIVMFVAYYGFHFCIELSPSVNLPYFSNLKIDYYIVCIMLFAIYFMNLIFVKCVAIPWWTKRKFTPKNANALLIALLIGIQAVVGSVLLSVVYQYGIQELNTAVAYSSLVLLNILLTSVFTRIASRRAKRDSEEALIIEQLVLQAKHYAEMAERYDKLRKLRHDFNNHIQVLNALNDTGKRTETHDYVGRLSDEFNHAEKVGFCGNSAVDAVLFHKQETALASGIRIEYQVMLPKDCGIAEFDLCGIFANLLDNAITACLAFDGEKYISLETKVQAGYFVIVQKNSSNPPSEPDKNDESHGLGLKIISDIAKRYNGNTYFEYNGNQFISVINLNLSRSG